MHIQSISSPSALIARGIETLILTGKHSEHSAVQRSCFVLSRVISVTLFPIFLALELVFKRIPLLIWSFTHKQELSQQLDQIAKFALAIIFSPLGLYCPSSVSGFFLQRSSSNTVEPFGVETQYGKQVDLISYPKTTEELQALVSQAKREKKQISIIGSGMSQGTQTVPSDPHHIVINMKHFNTIQLSCDKTTVQIGSGTTWEQLQIALNKEGKSSIVKQASDPFSIGGSIGINCHGWAHEEGSIASTVESLLVIDASGTLKRLTPQDEEFGCFFGTLGYFGIVVEATLRTTDNEHLIERSKEITPDQFSAVYHKEIKNKEIPLFGGRLTLDQLEGDPLRKICMVYYEKNKIANQYLGASSPTPHFLAEPPFGKRIERLFLQAISHISNAAVTRLLHAFWEREHQSMLQGRALTRNEALHPPINAFNLLHHSNLHAQWLQEYFVTEEHLPTFLAFLGKTLKENNVRLVNATIRPTPKDSISILPYAEQDRLAVVLSFAQEKTQSSIEKTQRWIESVNAHLVAQGDLYYQAYMPYATREQFEVCYGKQRVEKLREMKRKYDPDHLFGNAHTAKYYDAALNFKAPLGILAYLKKVLHYAN